MTPNPYQAPLAPATTARAPRIFVLAAAGAFLASAYWAALTLLLSMGVASGTINGSRIIFPVVLIVLYAMRGAQLLKGDPAAAQKILWLHGVGAVMAVVQMSSGAGLVVVLQAVKVAIHLFGGVMAWQARRAFLERLSGS